MDGFPAGNAPGRRRRRSRLGRAATLTAFAVSLAGSAGAGSAGAGSAGAQAPSAPPAPAIAAGAKAEDFLVVDCLLPTQLRRLGTRMTFAAPRRPIKTTTRDCEIRGGEYVAYDRANYSTALKVWLDAAKQGDAKAQTYVGEIYEKGLGTTPDYPAAAEWYRRAAAQGHATAAINLGSLYERGLGVPKDSQQALTWYRRASGLNDLTYEIAPDPADPRVVQLEAEVEQYRRELDKRRGELTSAQREADGLRQTLARREAEAQGVRAELAEQRRALSALEAGERTASPAQQALRSGIQEGEARLAEQEREANAIRTQLPRDAGTPATASEREVRELQGKLARVESESRARKAGLEPLRWERDPAGPEIELLNVQIVEPSVVAASAREGRGGPAGGAAPGAHVLLLVGRVASPANIQSFTINGIEQIADTSPRDTRFRAELTLADSRAERVRIVALDGAKRRTTVELGVPARVQLAAAPSGGSAPAPPRERSTLPAPSEGGAFHALVIGITNYASLDKLDTATKDAEAVSAALRQDYSFKVRMLANATRIQIMAHLNDLRERLADRDNLLVYYAGRGELNARSQRGYWLPSDARPNDPSSWISDVQLSDMLNVVPARQLLVVADSPYAATLTRSANGRLEPTVSDPHMARIMQMLSGKRARMVLTSGGVQPVSEAPGAAPSIFARSFIEVIRANGGVMLGRDVFRGVQVKLYAAARRTGITQVPDYAPIRYAGHDGGEFFFVKTGG